MSVSSGTRPDGAATSLTSDPVVVETYDAPVKGGGWLFFAGTVLGLAGLMRIVDSIWAFSYNGALPQGLKDGVLGDTLSNYAWVWMGVGVLLVIASLLVLVGSQLGRWVGLIAAGITALTAITWMPYYPEWSLVYITLSLLVIYALSAYGGRQDTY